MSEAFTRFSADSEALTHFIPIVRPQGVEPGMAGPGETLGSPWIALLVRAWFLPSSASS
jgi:hypothetical protein